VAVTISAVNYERIYELRFRGVDPDARAGVWGEVARWVWELLGRPRRVLDPAAGRCHFINAVPADERWAVDMDAGELGNAAPGTRALVADIFDADLPGGHFDAVWVSNFLEHLPSQGAVQDFLGRMHGVLRPGGRIAVMGPNIKFCASTYWDCCDHTLALSHVAVEEHLYSAGFELERTHPRFLPYSFRGRLPASAGLTRAYLGFPPAWRVLGRQFLVVGRRPAVASDRMAAT
jgi:SAM-dependent methyltransferase